MSKWVRLEDNIVRELLPHGATVPSVAHWYGEAFAARCVCAPDEVTRGWVYDPETDSFSEPVPEELVQVPEQQDAIAVLSDMVGIVFMQMAQTEQLDDVTIAEHADVFPAWDEHWTGKAGNIVRDNGALYRSIHDVGAGQNTRPSDTPSMWTMIGNPADEWPVWIKPLGAHDAYNEGDKVSHRSKRWTSNTGGNVWEPGVYGWTESM